MDYLWWANKFYFYCESLWHIFECGKWDLLAKNTETCHDSSSYFRLASVCDSTRVIYRLFTSSGNKAMATLGHPTQIEQSFIKSFF